MLHLQKKEGQACLQGSIVYKFYNPLPAHEGEGGGDMLRAAGVEWGMRSEDICTQNVIIGLFFFLNEQPISVQWEKYYSQKVGGI